MEEEPKVTQFTEEEFSIRKKRAEDFYHSIDGVKCPYFGTGVVFNARGLNHLKFKKFNVPRPRRDQFMRLKLIHLAPEILRQSKTVQGVWHTHLMERRQRNSRWEKVLTPVSFYEFIAVINQNRARVIVKQCEGGEPFFWSIIPYWRTNKFGKKETHEGNPEED